MVGQYGEEEAMGGVDSCTSEEAEAVHWET
jgi:hypothetical protein